jgi:hypothetical protein
VWDAYLKVDQGKNDPPLCWFIAGFLAANRIGPLKNDMDVDVTFEGDNTGTWQGCT